MRRHCKGSFFNRPDGQVEEDNWRWNVLFPDTPIEEYQVANLLPGNVVGRRH